MARSNRAAAALCLLLLLLTPHPGGGTTTTAAAASPADGGDTTRGWPSLADILPSSVFASVYSAAAALRVVAPDPTAARQHTTFSHTYNASRPRGRRRRRHLTQAVGGSMLENTYHIRGALVGKNDLTVRKADILQSCFMGFGFRKCEHEPLPVALWDDDEEAATEAYGPYRSDQPELPPYPFNWRSAIIMDQVYCLECCANTRLSYEFKETWNFKCDIADGGDADLKLMEIAPLAFRFARRESIDDETVVVCDLPHESEQTALTSYHLKLWVTEMSEGTTYFRGVRKCEATSTEDAGSNAFTDRVVFTETITLIHDAAQQVHAVSWTAFAVTLVAAAVTAAAAEGGYQLLC